MKRLTKEQLKSLIRKLDLCCKPRYAHFKGDVTIAIEPYVSKKVIHFLNIFHRGTGWLNEIGGKVTKADLETEQFLETPKAVQYCIDHWKPGKGYPVFSHFYKYTRLYLQNLRSERIRRMQLPEAAIRRYDVTRPQDALEQERFRRNLVEIGLKESSVTWRYKIEGIPIIKIEGGVSKEARARERKIDKGVKALVLDKGLPEERKKEQIWEKDPDEEDNKNKS